MAEQTAAQLEGAEINRDGQVIEEQNFESSEGAVEKQQPTEKLLTQAEVEKVLKKRLEREAKKYADYEELKAKAAEYEQKLEEQRLSELSEKERAEELAKKFEEEKLQLAKELEALRGEVASQKIRAKFNEVATAAGIAYLSDAYALADLSKVAVNENGEVEGVEEVVSAIVEHKPFLVKQAPKPIGQPSNGPSTSEGKTADQLLKEAAEKARKSGRPEDRAAYAKLKRALTRRK